MKKIIKAFSEKNIQVGYLYFYVHFITEVICFFALKRVVGDSIILWVSPVLYDLLAFVPQGVIGYFFDKKKLPKPGIIGILIIILGILNFNLGFIPGTYTSIAIIAIGNAFMHIAGAEATLRSSNGKMAHAAIFVAGGSFGVITGKILGATKLNMYLLIIAALTMIPFCLLADTYVDYKKKNVCKNFNYTNTKLSPAILIFLATFVVAIRGYTGYGIPTSWNKTIIQTVILFVFMGIGKALGGILIDTIGMRKTAIGSVLLAIPFLIIGDRLMVVSLIGVMLFSMTMAVTLGLLVSVLKESPGLAFGYTTLGLFLGSVPVFFFKITDYTINSIIVCSLSLLCVLALHLIIKKEN